MTYDQDRLRRTHLENKEVCPWRVAGTEPVLTCTYGEPGHSTCQAGQAVNLRSGTQLQWNIHMHQGWGKSCGKFQSEINNNWLRCFTKESSYISSILLCKTVTRLNRDKQGCATFKHHTAPQASTSNSSEHKTLSVKKVFMPRDALVKTSI